MDWKRFGILTFFKTIITAGVTTGLCFLFPPAIPIIIGVNVGALSLISYASVSAIKKDPYKDVPKGDIGYFYEEPKQSVTQKVETKVIDKTQELMGSIKDRVVERRREKEQRKAEAEVKKTAALVVEEVSAPEDEDEMSL